MGLKPKRVTCAECGVEVYSYRPHALCPECIKAAGRKVCACVPFEWEPLKCELHWGFNPYDIPY